MLAALVLPATGCTGGGSDRPSPDPTTSAPETTEPAEPDPTVTVDPDDVAPDDGQDDPTESPADGRTQVKPFISYVGPGTDPATIEVAGFVPELIEEGGTCTATMTGTGVTGDAPAYPDASSTSCGLIVLSVAPAGQTVVLSYSSPTSVGSSDAATVSSG